MPVRKRKKSLRGALIAKIRKPMAPPARVDDDIKKYRRERERERLRRERHS
ncbi:MAG TPA: hypothetical protein VIX59_02510 [Candidatus Binataceae bacterium]